MRVRFSDSEQWCSPVKPYLCSLLLRPRRERPGCRAAEQRDELATFHC
jgi:hypothetical protein